MSIYILRMRMIVDVDDAEVIYHTMDSCKGIKTNEVYYLISS